MKKYLLLIFFFQVTTVLRAQDIHFSQFNSSPLNINPALTGLFDGGGRMVLNHRSQWSSVTTPFVTTSGSFDINIKSGEKENYFGLGVQLNNDKAGDGHLSLFQSLFSLGYTTRLTHDGLFVSYGMQAGASQRSINYSTLTTESQYDGDRFQPGMSNGENFNGATHWFFDAGAGLNLFYEFKNSSNVDIGYSVFHLNKPDAGFLDNTYATLPPKSILHANGLIKLPGPFALLPGILILNQGSNGQINVGTYARYTIGKPSVKAPAVYFGTWFRLKDMDAMILSARIDYHRLNFGLSYDINTSRLSEASQYKGGVEISLIYTYEKAKKIPKFKKIPCPMFM